MLGRLTGGGGVAKVWMMKGGRTSIRTLGWFVVVVGVALAVGCGAGGGREGLSAREAERLMHSYVAALRSGGTEEIHKHWWATSLSREGFETMHLWVGATIHIDQWSEFLRDSGLDFEIKGVRHEDAYNVIDFEWVERSGAAKAEGGRHEMHYYVVRQGGKWVLGNPIDVLTADWGRYETDNLVFRYPPYVDIGLHMDEIERVDEECGRMVKALEVELERKIEFFKAASPVECGRLVSFPPANGYAVIQKTDHPNDPPWFNVAVSTAFNNPHEVMHVLAATAGIPYVSAAFCEGYAVAYGGTTYQSPEFALVQARNLIGTSDFIGLDSLFAMEDRDFLRSSYITYQEAGAFVRFAIDTFSIGKLRQVCDDLAEGKELDSAFERAYGLGIAELEDRWKAYLLDRDTLDIGTSIPVGAEAVFSMADPEGDDTGDGDYAYPGGGRFKEGVFDLRAFEVLKDSTHIYFRVKLENTDAPVTYNFSDERFSPGVVVAIRRGEGGRHERTCHGVEFEQGLGYDLKLAAGFGVSLSDAFGKVFYASRDLYDGMFKEGENLLEFSLPVSAIGEPELNWRYFVGVGLVSDRTMSFFGGPMPVRKEHNVLISGGNFSHGNPAFIDILLPEGTSQESLLGAYDADKGALAVVSMLEGEG